ncbi:MAG: TRAP transporter substrate-binding protein [Lawsonibacter sp.]|jgi:tripartite ATP-independent transporter DctP family solute receptor|nr:TRAP transporter substrate-binding protein [Lawsonibacter sp.]
MKKNIRGLSLLLSAAMLLTLSACGSSGSPAGSGTTSSKNVTYTFDISVDASDDEIISQYAKKLKEELENRSEGRISATVYTNGTLGGDSEALQSCADGSLAFVLSTTAPQVNLMPELAVFDLPNLYTDIDQFRALFENQELIDKLNQIYTQNGFQLLGIADSGFRVMTSNKEVNSMSDLSGVKIRTMQNSNHIAIWQAYGANPTPMSFGEVYIGLQQGTIVAQENPIEVAVASKFYEQQKYVILTNHLPHACVCLMSGDVYASLPADLQEVVLQAGEAATEYTRQLSSAQNAEQLQFLEENDTVVIQLPDQVYEEMRTAAQPVYDAIAEQVGQEMMDLLLSAAES